MWISKNPHTALKDWYIGAKVTSKIQRHKAWAKSGARGVKAEEKGKRRACFQIALMSVDTNWGCFICILAGCHATAWLLLWLLLFPRLSLSSPSVSKLISTNNRLATAGYALHLASDLFLYLVIIRHTVSHHRQILSAQWRSFLLNLDYRYFIQTFFNRCTIKAAKPPKHIQHSNPLTPTLA